jgi:hypothetical protein
MSDNYDDYDDYDSEYEEQKINDRHFEEAEYTNKRLYEFPEDEWIKTHPEFMECFIHTFQNSDTPSRILFGLKGGAYSTIDLCDGYTGKAIDVPASDNLWTIGLDLPDGSLKKFEFNSTKRFVENAIVHFDKNENINPNDIFKYLKQQCKQLQNQPKTTLKELAKTTDLLPISDRQLETAQKTGYVQGVCESVLAFNNDENRKIMTEATMTFLSKKLLSEMNVTKDMAQKFANPETYKALEQSVFAPKQEQQLEQTQSRGR